MTCILLFFFFPFPPRCDGRDMDFASLMKAHHALRIIIDNAQKEAEQASTWQIMPLLVLIVLLTSTLMLIVLTNPYQLWSP